jgi:hypothetical protein
MCTWFRTIRLSKVATFLGAMALAGLISLRCEAGSTAAIRVSTDGRYLVIGNGQPFLWQGITEWELFRLFSVSDAKELMLKRRSQGFTVIQVMVTGVPPEYSPIAGPQAWLGNNPLTPDESYFKRADSIVTAARECGMVLVLGVFHVRDTQSRITVQNAKPWAKWLAQRYEKTTNIIWSMYPSANQSFVPVVQATVQGLKEGDNGSHLITLHPDPSPTSSSFMHPETWLSFNTIQTFSSTHLNYEMVIADYSRTPVKPVVNGEARYETEDGTSPLDIRRGAYWSYLAGGFYSYGHAGNWQSPSTWRQWVDSPGAVQMKVLGDLFRSLNWWKLVPDQSIFSDGASQNAAARSTDGDWILVYFSTNIPARVKLDRITATNSVTGSWIDPASGERTKIGTLRASGTHDFTPPSGWQDAILLLQK